MRGAGLGRTAMDTLLPPAYLQKASLQQEHLVCIGGGPSQETFHSPGLPKPATQVLTLDQAALAALSWCRLNAPRGRVVCSPVSNIYLTFPSLGPSPRS